MYVVRRFLPWRPYEEANLIDPEDLSIQGKLFFFVRSCEFEIIICEQKWKKKLKISLQALVNNDRIVLINLCQFELTVMGKHFVSTKQVS